MYLDIYSTSFVLTVSHFYLDKPSKDDSKIIKIMEVSHSGINYTHCHLQNSVNLLLESIAYSFQTIPEHIVQDMHPVDISTVRRLKDKGCRHTH